MNVERLIELRERIRGAKYNPGTFTGEGVEFCMSSYWRYIPTRVNLRDCKTPACLAGHTVVMWGDLNDPRLDRIAGEQEVACELLGLTREQGCRLFSPFCRNWYEITPGEAVIAIDRLITNPNATDKELWSDAQTKDNGA